MKSDWKHLEQWRLPNGGRTGHRSGAFRIPMGNRFACVIADDGVTNDGPGSPTGWEHCSVHMQTVHGEIAPSWNEMSRVRDLFWGEDEVIMQLHVAGVNHIDINKHVLHLWKPLNQTIPLPPKELV